MDTARILPNEISVPWLKPSEVVDMAATTRDDAGRREDYKRLANLADKQGLPFIKPGQGRTSARLYPPLAILRLRFEYELQGAFYRDQTPQAATSLAVARIEQLAGVKADFDLAQADCDFYVHLLKHGTPVRFEEYDVRRGWPNMRCIVGGFFGVLRLHTLTEGATRIYREFRTDELQRNPDRVRAMLAAC